MENKHVSEELSDWQEVHSPFSTISEPSVFPPGNHEDLPIRSPILQEPEPVHTPPPPPPGGDGVRRWRRLLVGIVQTGILGLRNCATCKVGLWSFAWIAGGVASLFLVWFWGRRVLVWRQRRLQLDSSKNSLMAIIREKDKKINQLLLQIAQMNEILLARRRVPVLRVKGDEQTKGEEMKKPWVFRLYSAIRTSKFCAF